MITFEFALAAGGWVDSLILFDTSPESTPGRDKLNEVGGSLEDDAVSRGGTTPPALATGLYTWEEDKTGTLESLTSDPEGLPGLMYKPVDTGGPEPAL